jgi:hypothetical protein
MRFLEEVGFSWMLKGIKKFINKKAPAQGAFLLSIFFGLLIKFCPL